MKNPEADYEAGCEATYDAVRAWLWFGNHAKVEVWMTEPGIALLAAIDDVKESIARNHAARLFIDHIIRYAWARGLDAPTVMMLRVVMDKLGMKYKCVPLADLSLKNAALIRKDQRGEA